MRKLWPVLIGLGLLWLVLSRRRLGFDIMENLNITKPAPKYAGTVHCAWFHWRDVRAMLKYPQTEKTARALANTFRAAGLSQVFQSRGYCWRALAAISLHETGYGTSHAAYAHDNLWGVSYDSGAGVYVPYAYESMGHAAEHLLSVLNHSRYNEARSVKADGLVFLLALNRAGYNSSVEWREGVKAAFAKLELV
jgi:hypothetical protein